MKIERKLVLIVVVLNVLGAIFVSAATSELTFGEILSSPVSPTPLSTITVSITLSGETPSEVKMWIQECNKGTGICYADAQNVSMSLVSAGKYEVDVTLKHADATYITCHAWAKTDSAWESSAKKNITLSESSNGNTNGDNGNGGNNIPGFEVIVLVVAIGISVILLKRKRFR